MDEEREKTTTAQKFARITPLFVGVVLLAMTVGVFQTFFYLKTEKNRIESGLLRVVFLDIGQGDSIFIEAPNGNQILIDTGATSAVVRRLSSVMPFYDRNIDMVIATHFDLDHVGGFPDIFKRYEVVAYTTSDEKEDTALYNEVENKAKQNKSDRIFVAAGDRVIIDSSKNIYMDILWPPATEDFPDRNDASVVARIVYGETAFVLTGDAPQFVEEKIATVLRGQIDSEVIKVGHHGSRTSTAMNFVSAINPQFAIISVGADNKFGHPHPETIETLQKYAESTNQEIQILNTAESGSVTLLSNGEKIWRSI